MSLRRRFAPALLVALMLLGGFAGSGSVSAQATERILNYRVEMTIERDTDIRVVETIEYDFGSNERRGIVRDIITKQRYDEIYDRTYEIDDIKVQADRGASGQVEELREGNLTRVRIGDPDKTISGPHTYRIEYLLRGALNGFDDHDELYWNVIGDQWQAPIANISVRVTVPDGGTQGAFRVACFAGPTGSALSCDGARLTQRVGEFTQRNLDPYEGLTIVYGMPKGVVEQPQPILVQPWSFQRAFSLGVAQLAAFAAVLAAVVAAVWRMVWTIGRDQRFRGSPVDVVFGGNTGEQRVPLFEGDTYSVEYTPHDDLRPGQLGTLVDERANPVDVTASVIDLAARGYLHIEEIPKEGWFGKTDWRLKKQAAPVDKRPLLPYEQTLLDGLFEDGDEVLLSDLKTKFYKTLQTVQQELYADAVSRGWFARSPDSTRNWWLGIGFAVLVGAAALVFLAARFTTFGIVPLPLVLGGLALLALNDRMPARTPKGTAAYRRSLGFKQYIETAETRRSEFAEKAGLFYDYLPYAVAFGAVGAWAKAFEGISLPAPAWYGSSAYTGAYMFNAAAFSENVEGFATSSTGTFTSTPGGSGSSGFGGGGFSGGGGGGGGGGSW